MKLIIVGAGKQAELAYRAFSYLWMPHDTATGAGSYQPYQPVAFAVEREYYPAPGTTMDVVPVGIPLITCPLLVIDDILETFYPHETAFHVAITFDKLNATRVRLYRQMKEWGYQPASYIAPTSVVPSTVKLGEHVFINALNNIDDYVTVGDCVYMHTLNHIGHHSAVRDNVFISSGVVVSGGCDIGENTFIGVNAAIGHNVKIGARCIIGAGTLVTHDIPDDSVVKRAGDKPDGRKSSEVTL